MLPIRYDKGSVDIAEVEIRYFSRVRGAERRGLAHVHPAQGREDKLLSETQEGRNRRIAKTPCTRRARVWRSGADGKENAAQHRTGARDAMRRLFEVPS